MTLDQKLDLIRNLFAPHPHMLPATDAVFLSSKFFNAWQKLADGSMKGPDATSALVGYLLDLSKNNVWAASAVTVQLAVTKQVVLWQQNGGDLGAMVAREVACICAMMLGPPGMLDAVVKLTKDW
jgi:hypothetical protein